MLVGGMTGTNQSRSAKPKKKIKNKYTNYVYVNIYYYYESTIPDENNYPVKL